MQSIQFKASTESPIMLKEGMESQYQFTTGPQEEGQKFTAEYIADTIYFHALGSQIKELPEGQKRKQLKKQQSEVLKKVRLLQQNDYIIEFSAAIKEGQKKEQLETVARTIEKIQASSITLPVLEGLHPSLPPLNEKLPSHSYQPGTSHPLRTPPKDPPDRQEKETVRKSLLNNGEGNIGSTNNSNNFPPISGNKEEIYAPSSPLIFQDKENVPPKENLDVPTVDIQEGIYGSDQEDDDDDDDSSEEEEDPRDVIVGNMIKVLNGHMKTRAS